MARRACGSRAVEVKRRFHGQRASTEITDSLGHVRHLRALPLRDLERRSPHAQPGFTTHMGFAGFRCSRLPASCLVAWEPGQPHSEDGMTVRAAALRVHPRVRSQPPDASLGSSALSDA